MNRVIMILTAIASHIEATVRRVQMHRIYVAHDSDGRRYNGPDRRRNPRYCPTCGGPMRPDKRPPRDVRSHDGKIRRVPEETLEWFACTRCHRSLIGVPLHKLQNGWRPAA